MSFCLPCDDEDKEISFAKEEEIIFKKESHNDDLFFYNEDSEDSVTLIDDVTKYCNTSITEIDDDNQ